jgi:hypothetical protein
MAGGSLTVWSCLWQYFLCTVDQPERRNTHFVCSSITFLLTPKNWSLFRINVFKGTFSPDITFYFRFCKIKSVLSVRPLRVLKFLFRSSLDIYIYILNLLLWKHLLILQILTETHYRELFPGFSKQLSVKSLSVSRWCRWNYLHSHVWLSETGQ